MTKTELRLQWVDSTLDIEFPECIEKALENDYVLNSTLYTNAKIKRIRVYLLLCPEITPENLIEMVHNE